MLCRPCLTVAVVGLVLPLVLAVPAAAGLRDLFGGRSLRVDGFSCAVSLPEGHEFLAARTVLQAAYTTSHLRVDFLAERVKQVQGYQRTEMPVSVVVDGRSVALTFQGAELKLPRKNPEAATGGELYQTDVIVELTMLDPGGEMVTARYSRLSARMPQGNLDASAEMVDEFARNRRMGAELAGLFDGLVIELVGKTRSRHSFRGVNGQSGESVSLGLDRCRHAVDETADPETAARAEKAKALHSGAR